MKSTVVGAGAIGGYLGARLAIAGEDVTFIARNRNLAAINGQGFTLINEDGSTQHTSAVRAVQKMADAGPQDAVLLTLKAHQVREVLPDLPALFGPQTTVVTMINGVPWWYFQRLGHGLRLGHHAFSQRPAGWEPADVLQRGMGQRRDRVEAEVAPQLDPQLGADITRHG